MHNAGIHLFMGNEAADADSIISSIVYCYHSSEYRDRDASSQELFLPMIAIPRDQFLLRCEVKALFDAIGLEQEACVFLDDVSWEVFDHEWPGKCNVHLLDHNEATGPIAQLIAKNPSSFQVAEILDHHAPTNAHPDVPSTSCEIAFDTSTSKALAGSCCTIVSEKLVSYWETKRKVEDVDALLATMLLGVISLDTVNLDPSAHKVTPRDSEMARILEKSAFMSREDLFQWLQDEKFNTKHWEKFTMENCLICDFKQFVAPSKELQYGVSSILIHTEPFLEKAGSSYATELHRFCEDRNLDFLVVMSLVMEGNTPTREILFFAHKSKPAFEKLLAFVKENPSIQPSELHLPSQYHQVQAFTQGNAAASRKQVVPLIQSFLSGCNL